MNNLARQHDIYSIDFLRTVRDDALTVLQKPHSRHYAGAMITKHGLTHVSADMAFIFVTDYYDFLYLFIS